jgi:hypothetical protein
MIAFLSGEPADLTPELAQDLLTEFRAQDRYRESVTIALRSVAGVIQARAAKLQPELDQPYKQAEQYGAGYRAGAYNEASNAAQLVQDVINGAVGRIA